MNFDLPTIPGSPSPLQPSRNRPTHSRGILCGSSARGRGGFDVYCIQFHKFQNLSHGFFMLLDEIFVYYVSWDDVSL